MKPFFFCFLLFQIIACNSSTSNLGKDSSFVFQDITQKDIDGFWKWMSDNRKMLDTLPYQSRLDIIYEAITVLNDGFHLEISSGKINGVHDMILSANGNEELFPLIKQIALSKPAKGLNWTIQPLRPRGNNNNNKINVDGIVFNINDMYFSTKINETDLLDIVVYAPNLEDLDYNFIYNYISILCDHLLGEEDFATQINNRDFVDLKYVGETEIFPLIELPQFIDNRKNK